MDETIAYQGNKFTTRELKNCPECDKPRISFGWCFECETNALKENFIHCSTENEEIDQLIKFTQLKATPICDYLEYIPFEKFDMIKYIGSGGFGSVYSAIWIEGPRWIWDDESQEWSRSGPMNVVLKRLDNSQNISSSYIAKLRLNTRDFDFQNFKIHSIIGTGAFASVYAACMKDTQTKFAVKKFADDYTEEIILNE
ncbi:6688_t:CDS:2, partial [Funneliformis geosporum]